MLNYIFAILATAMLPVSELRVAIPLGVAVFHIHPLLVYIIAVMGNILPIFFLLWFWEKAAQFFAERFQPLGKLLHWLFERTRKRFYEKHQRFGIWALVIFVAIPLPITGAWTGSIAAWLFGIPYKRAITLIFVGILISGAIVTLLTVGIIKII